MRLVATNLLAFTRSNWLYSAKNTILEWLREQHKYYFVQIQDCHYREHQCCVNEHADPQLKLTSFHCLISLRK